MNGVQKDYNKRRKEIRAFLKQYNPYDPQPLTGFDLRGYADYIKANQIDVEHITPELMNRFVMRD